LGLFGFLPWEFLKKGSFFRSFLLNFTAEMNCRIKAKLKYSYV
jgi:hypothetical protein